MRSLLLVVLGLAILIALPCQASIVIHGAGIGIVACGYAMVLDSMGQAWNPSGAEGWIRLPLYDAPIPINDMTFWDERYIITTSNDLWAFVGGVERYRNMGHWPGLADVEPVADPTVKSMIAPNPSPGPCRVSFQVATEGPVSVEVIDVTGRMLRRLLDGPHPAGDYSVIWDGRDDGGRDLPSGTYWTKITMPSGTTTARIVLAK